MDNMHTSCSTNIIPDGPCHVMVGIWDRRALHYLEYIFFIRFLNNGPNAPAQVRFLNENMRDSDLHGSAEFHRSATGDHLRLLFHCCGGARQREMGSGANLSGVSWRFLSGQDFPYNRAVRMTIAGLVWCRSYPQVQHLFEMVRTLTRLGRGHIESFRQALPFPRPLHRWTFVELSMSDWSESESPWESEEDWDWDIDWIPCVVGPAHLR